jgi:hypothetical protein
MVVNNDMTTTTLLSAVSVCLSSAHIHVYVQQKMSTTTTMMTTIVQNFKISLYVVEDFM